MTGSDLARSFEGPRCLLSTRSRAVTASLRGGGPFLRHRVTRRRAASADSWTLVVGAGHEHAYYYACGDRHRTSRLLLDPVVPASDASAMCATPTKGVERAETNRGNVPGATVVNRCCHVHPVIAIGTLDDVVCTNVLHAPRSQERRHVLFASPSLALKLRYMPPERPLPSTTCAAPRAERRRRSDCRPCPLDACGAAGGRPRPSSL